MGAVTLLIVAASVAGACIAAVGLVRIYNQRPIWNRGEAAEPPGQNQHRSKVSKLSPHCETRQHNSQSNTLHEVIKK